MTIRIKLLLTIFSIFFGAFANGQKISNIDFEDVKQKTTDSSSPYYYPTLLERFVGFDTTLHFHELNYIYYGNVYSEQYSPYGTAKDESQFLELYNKQKFSEAISYGNKTLEENPINIKILFKMLVCHHNLGDKENAAKFAFMYFSLIDVIYKSGNGKSAKTAYVVIKVPDEYAVLSDLELRLTKQALVGDTDVMYIDKKGQKPPKGQKKIKALYFNVSKPLEYMMEQFKKSE